MNKKLIKKCAKKTIARVSKLYGKGKLSAKQTAIIESLQLTILESLEGDV